ncbi:MAG: tetratricopeptide repeat protein [Cyanobacteria bacterium P01_A01_bin.135]
MGYSVDVTTQTFKALVLEASHSQPILVDFFAQWCGPCQMLKPMLEKLVQEYNVGLAKVDIDQNPELANAYGVEGVPDVRIAVAGQMQPGFVGMVGEAQLRSLLEGLGITSAVETKLQEIQGAVAAGETESVSEALDELIEQHPGDERAVSVAVPFWLGQQQFHRAQTAFEAAAAVVPNPNSAAMRTLRGQLQLAQYQQDVDPSGAALGPLAGQVQDDPEAALAGMLALLEGGDHRETARKAMIAVFDLLGDDHPLTKAYRKKMMMALF